MSSLSFNASYFQNHFQSPKRVKVYYLIDNDWQDQGTGYCLGRIENKFAYLIVNSENNDDSILLKSKIEPNTQYQKQQTTLIVWTDSSGQDIALSFQESIGCSLLCDFLLSVQQILQPSISLVSVTTTENGEINEVISNPIEFPPNPSLNHKNLLNILDILIINSSTALGKLSMAKFIHENNFVLKLIKIFQKSEKNHLLKNLHILFNIIKTLILYNENSIFDHLFDNDIDSSIQFSGSNNNNNNESVITKFYKNSILINIIGILEYDPDFPLFKAKYRQFLLSDLRFKEILPNSNFNSNLNFINFKKLLKKTFIYQYLKDVVLARFLDDAMFTVISTIIYYNHCDIIKYLEKSDFFLKNIFNIFTVNNSSLYNLEEKRNTLKMIYQFITMCKNIQQQESKSVFYKSLIKNGLFKMLQFALKDLQTDSRTLATEILLAITDQDVLLINHIYKKNINTNNSIITNDINLNSQNANNSKTIPEMILSDDMSLLLLLTELVLQENNSGLKIQIFEAIKGLLNIPTPSFNDISLNNHNFNIDNNDQKEFDPSSDFRSPPSPDFYNKDFENNRINFRMNNVLPPILNCDYYFDAFYKIVAPKLFFPIIALNKQSPLQTSNEIGGTQKKRTKYDITLFNNLCDLISFCCNEHRLRARAFF
ncbi:Psy2p, partial [Ascoidea rubescens DSM 1968]